MSELEKRLVYLVKENLSLNMLDDAVFFAERLNASYMKDENTHLLAECYLRKEQCQRVISLLAGSTNEQNRYLFAVAAIRINRLDDAERALVPNENNEVPNGAYGYYLLGRISRLKNKFQQAGELFCKALSLNPEVWSAYRELCEIGLAGLPQEKIQVIPYDAPISDQIFGRRQLQGERDPLSVDVTDVNQTPSPYTPDQMMIGSTSRRKVLDFEGKVVKVMKTGGAKTVERGSQEVHLRRSSRLMEKQQKQHGVGTIQEDQQFQEPNQTQELQHDGKICQEMVAAPSEGKLQLLKLLRQLGLGYYYLCKHDSRACVEAFQELPEQQHSTSWVMTQIGKAHYEALDYREAITSFQKAFRLDPSSVHGLEYYSTVLWLIGDEVGLSVLSQHALSADRKAPETWCAMGNCFSLQKEHQTAVKYFQRALQMDTNFGYAYTLLGHEYFAIENHEKATVCFRNAMLKDKLNYNAWFGLGQIYYREEKYDFAKYHFEEARRINPGSSVVSCYYGMTQNKLKQYNDAINNFDYALELDPKNPLPRHEKAMMLTQMGDLENAIYEFEQLRELLPQEATTCLHLGRLYKKVGKLDLAVVRLRDAMDLTQSNTECNLIKSIMEKIHVTDVDEQPDL